MAYRHAYISNLKYIDEVFHNIAHNYPHPDEQGYTGYDDDTLSKWECVDDRFSTGFGSTYEVPITDFPKREDEVVITIFGDTWLHIDEISYTDTFLSHRESPDDTFNVGRAQFKESLPEVLERVFPNGTVNLIGDFSYTSTTDINLDDVYLYINNIPLADAPNYFIFNGIVNTLYNKGKSYTINRLKEIDSICSRKSVKACCIFTDNELNQYIDVNEYLDVFSTTTKMLKFSVAEWVTHHVNVVENNYEINSNGTNIDKYFGNPDFTIEFNFSEDIPLKEYIVQYNLENKSCYKEIVYTVVKRFVLNELFFLHRECFYISFLYKSVHGGLGGTTYDFYFGTENKPYNLIPCIPWREQWIKINDSTTGFHQTKYGNNQSWNLFKNSGQFVGVCLHTGFSEYLWAWQQGQSSLYNEFVNMKNNSANFLLERVYTRPKSDYTSVPPVFPGTCCSMFTISTNNVKDYANKLGNIAPIDIWVTRDNYSSTITLRLRTEDDKPDLYQSIEFGRMSAVETENYNYPLYVGGGSTGLSCDIYVYTPVGGTYKHHIEGNVYDLDMNNICLSNSNILHPTRFYGSTFSNFRVLTPEGIWRDIFSHEQTASIVSYPSIMYTPDYAIHLNVPTNGLGNRYDGAYPFLEDNKYTIGSQYINNRNWLCKEPVDNRVYRFSSSLDSIRVGLNHDIGDGQYLSYGVIPHCWRSWDKEVPSGEFTIDGKKYLAVPCGWDGRLWDYGYHLGIHNDMWEAEDIVEEFDKYYYKQNARIEDKLIIELGDIDV